MSWKIVNNNWTVSPTYEMRENERMVPFYDFKYKNKSLFGIYLCNMHENTMIVRDLLIIISKFETDNFVLNEKFSFYQKTLEKDNIFLGNKIIPKEILHSIWDDKYEIFWVFNDKKWFVKNLIMK